MLAVEERDVLHALEFVQSIRQRIVGLRSVSVTGTQTNRIAERCGRAQCEMNERASERVCMSAHVDMHWKVRERKKERVCVCESARSEET